MKKEEIIKLGQMRQELLERAIDRHANANVVLVWMSSTEKGLIGGTYLDPLYMEIVKEEFGEEKMQKIRDRFYEAANKFQIEISGAISWGLGGEDGSFIMVPKVKI